MVDQWSFLISGEFEHSNGNARNFRPDSVPAIANSLNDLSTQNNKLFYAVNDMKRKFTDYRGEMQQQTKALKESHQRIQSHLENENAKLKETLQLHQRKLAPHPAPSPAISTLALAFHPPLHPPPPPPPRAAAVARAALLLAVLAQLLLLVQTTLQKMPWSS